MILTYDMSKRGTLPLYEYLYRCIREDCESGQLAVGEKLPSKRALASHLSLSVVTVENAYAQLVDEGYIITKEKSGYYVSGTFSGIRASVAPPRSTIVEPRKPKKSAEETPLLLDLTSNEISVERFPFSVWSRLSREVLSTKQTELLWRVPTEGVMELREAISEYLKQFRGLTVSPEQIVIGAGAEYLYQLLIQLFSRSATFVLEDPGYHKTMHIYRANQVPYTFAGLDKEGILVNDLPNAANLPGHTTIAHVSPSHHYPTGIVTSPARRAELLRWVHEVPGRYLLEDEFDSEFRFSGKPLPTLFGTDRGQKVIYMNTFSKSISPSIRISYMVLPEGLMNRFHRSLGFYSCTVPSFEQYTLARFISEGYLTKHVNRMKNAYRKTRNELIRLLSESALSKCTTIHEEDAGLHLLLRVDTKRSDVEIIRLAKEAGVKLQALSDYCIGTVNREPHTFVVNYSGVTEETLGRVGEAFSNLERVFGL